SLREGQRARHRRGARGRGGGAGARRPHASLEGAADHAERTGVQAARTGTVARREAWREERSLRHARSAVAQRSLTGRARTLRGAGGVAEEEEEGPRGVSPRIRRA